MAADKSRSSSFEEDYEDYEDYQEQDEYGAFDDTLDDFAYPEIKHHDASKALIRPTPLGTAVTLTGHQLTLLAFVSVEQQRWSSRQRKMMTRDLRTAQDFLVSEARRHDQSLSFQTLELEHQVSISSGEAQELINARAPDMNAEELSRQVTRTLQKRHGPAWIDKLKREHKALGVSLVVVLNTSGRSFAVEHITGHEVLVEPSVIYQSYMGIESGPGVFAHEMLHNYGAIDLYAESSDTLVIHGALTHSASLDVQKKWPDAIMLNVNDVEPEIRQYVDPFTAWLLGWSSWADETFYRYILHNQDHTNFFY